MNDLEVSVVMPCLNEAATVRKCIDKARVCLQRINVAAEIIIADNGSTDGSQELARNAGARVIHVEQRGYGAALRAGIEAAQGRYVIMGDADDSYDFATLEPFLEKLRNGDQLVMGNRFAGGIGKGAMPLLHRYLGNPVLSFFGRLFFKVPIGDFHCGLRAFDRGAILRLGLSTSGMEFASEMVVKAGLAQLRIAEVPTTLAPDGRDRAPHLRTWRDGWRHLRFLLIFSPRWLFLYPGAMLLLVGTLLQSWLLNGSVRLGSLGLDIHTLLYASAMSVVGTQMIWFAVLAKVYGMRLGLAQRQSARIENALRVLTLERGVAVGLTLLAGGVILSVRALAGWAHTHYGALDPHEVMRTAIPSVSMILIGMEFVLASFFLGILRIEHGEILPHQTTARHPISIAPSSTKLAP